MWAPPAVPALSSVAHTRKWVDPSLFRFVLDLNGSPMKTEIL